MDSAPDFLKTKRATKLLSLISFLIVFIGLTLTPKQASWLTLLLIMLVGSIFVIILIMPLYVVGSYRKWEHHKKRQN